jgi:hypothetical protein
MDPYEMANLRIDLSQPHSYDEVELVPDLSGAPSVKQVEVPGGVARHRIMIRVTLMNA